MDILSDTNIFLAVALDEPEKSQIIQLTSQASIIAPKILPYEIGNALSAMIKRKQLTKHEALEAQKIVNRIPVSLDGAVFSLKSKEKTTSSPFDVAGIKTAATTQNILEAIQLTRTND